MSKTGGMFSISVDPRVPGAVENAVVALGVMFGISREETIKKMKENDEWLAWRDRDPKGWMKAHIARERAKVG